MIKCFSLLILIYLNPCPSEFETMDRETGKRVRQVLLLNRLESPQEQEHFLDNLSRNSKFRNLLGRLYPSNQESGARELMGLILAARTDSSGLLRYVSSKVTNPSYSRALPFIWLRPTNQSIRHFATMPRTTNHSIRFPCLRSRLRADPVVTQATLLMPMINLISTQL